MYLIRQCTARPNKINSCVQVSRPVPDLCPDLNVFKDFLSIFFPLSKFGTSQLKVKKNPIHTIFFR